jgi:hypothetical protein
MRIALVLVGIVWISTSARAQETELCSAMDSAAAAAAIRQRLTDWTAEVNRGDRASSTIWAQPVEGWFPHGPEFSDSAAYAAAGLSPTVGPAIVRYSVTVDEVAVSGRQAAVHDIWQEMRRFPGSSITVSREIRGSELWRCQPDGTWRIRRWVSAPEHWHRAPQ